MNLLREAAADQMAAKPRSRGDEPELKRLGVFEANKTPLTRG